MRLNELTELLGLGLVLAVAAVGCKSTDYGLTKLPDKDKAGAGSDLSRGAPVKPGDGDVEGKEHPIVDPDLRKDWPRDAKIFEADTAHFDYDSSVIKTDDKSKVAAVADYLKANSQDALEIDGHADERGTEEYNRSLGERRALALREELIRLGIDATRVDTMTLGKDRPVDTGHDDFHSEIHPPLLLGKVAGLIMRYEFRESRCG